VELVRRQADQIALPDRQVVAALERHGATPRRATRELDR
jgi:hypothetical protein